MYSQIAKLIDEPYDPDTEMRIALRYRAYEKAAILARTRREGPERISHRLWLIEVLEACKKYGGEAFWADVLAGVRATMEGAES